METLVDVINSNGVIVRANQMFLSEDDASKLFCYLRENVVFQQENGIMGNRPKRTSCAYGDTDSSGVQLVYRYSKNVKKSLPWSEELLELKKRVEDATGDTYNFALINYYCDGTAQIPWHSDDERDIDHTCSIGSISVGAVRKFKMKENSTQITTDVFLQHGSLLVMGSGTQQKYKHAMLKSTVVNTPRYNITFRKVRV